MCLLWTDSSHPWRVPPLAQLQPAAPVGACSLSLPPSPVNPTRCLPLHRFWVRTAVLCPATVLPPGPLTVSQLE